MIKITDNSNYLQYEIHNQGYELRFSDGEWSCSPADEAAIQSIIDGFDPLPPAKEYAREIVKAASAEKRLLYVTQAAGKDAEYTFKAQEAAQFNIDETVGVFMQGRINATGESAAVIALEWNAKGIAWKQVGAMIAGLEDKFSIDLAAETDWTKCEAIALAAVASIEAI